MRILIISSIGYEGGGAETTITLLKHELTRMGHTVRIITSDKEEGGGQSHFSDVEFRACAGRSFFGKAVCRIYNRSACRVVARALREFAPDIVQVHTTYEVSPSVLFLLRNTPSLLVVHGAEDYTKELLLWGFPHRFFKSMDEEPRYAQLTFEGKLHYIYHRIVSMPVYAYALRCVTYVVVVSTYMQTMLARQGVKSVCIPNATKLPEAVPLNRDSTIILYAGRLEKLKGVQHLISALPLIRACVPHARLVIAGTGTYETELHRLAHDLSLEEHIEWCGHVDSATLHSLYAMSAVVAVPSVWPEPFGKVGIEAMGVGRAVVASDVGGISEWLVDGVTGYLVPPNTVPALSNALVRILTDTKLRERMSDEGRKHAKKFHIARFCESLLKLHRRCVACTCGKELHEAPQHT